MNIGSPNFEEMVSQIYPAELQLNKANTSGTKASFLDFYIYQFKTELFHLKSLTNAMILISALLIFPFLDGDVPRTTSYGVYIYQFLRFASVSGHLIDFNSRNKS